MVRSIGGFFAAVIVTYLLGVLFVSQANLANVAAMGMTIDWSHRIDAILHDLVNMVSLYLPLIAVGLLIAFAVTGGLLKFVPNLRLIGFVLAGFVGLIALHMIMKAALGMSGIAPTRTLIGLLAQGVAGAVGGFIYVLVAPAMPSSESQQVE